MFPSKFVYDGHVGTHVGNGIYKLDNPYECNIKLAHRLERDGFNTIYKYLKDDEDDSECTVIAFLANDMTNVYDTQTLLFKLRELEERGGDKYGYGYAEYCNIRPHSWTSEVDLLLDMKKNYNEEELQAMGITDEYIEEVRRKEERRREADEKATAELNEMCSEGTESITEPVTFPEHCLYRGCKCSHVRDGVYKFDIPLLASYDGLTNPINDNIIVGLECIDKEHFWVRYIAYEPYNPVDMDKFLKEEFPDNDMMFGATLMRGPEMFSGINPMFLITGFEVPQNAPDHKPEKWKFSNVECEHVKEDIYKVSEPFKLNLEEVQDDVFKLMCFVCKVQDDSLFVHYISRWYENEDLIDKIAYDGLGRDAVIVRPLCRKGVHIFKGCTDNAERYGDYDSSDIKVLD